MKRQRHYSTVPETLNYGQPLSSSKNLGNTNLGYLEWKNVSEKQIPGNSNQLCQRRHAVCGSLETQSKEQHYAMTALPSPWLATVQVENTVKLKEWNANSIFNFIAYPEKKRKKKKTPQNNIQQQRQQKRRTHIFISAEKLAHSWHFHTILFTWLATKFKNECAVHTCPIPGERRG